MHSSDQRPLSPHLTIYKPQITTVLSIMHRFTGVFLYAGLVLFAIWLVLNVYGCGACLYPMVVSLPGKILLFLWSGALYYHLFNGIRHLAWDAGWGFGLRQVYISGAGVIIATAVFTVATWICAYMV